MLNIKNIILQKKIFSILFFIVHFIIISLFYFIVILLFHFIITILLFQQIIIILLSTGASHGDELSYLFKWSLMDNTPKNSFEENSIETVTKIWTNFAKFGDPNGLNTNESDLGVKWRPVKKNQLHFLDIGENLVLGVNPEPERMAFWDAVYSMNPNVWYL